MKGCVWVQIYPERGYCWEWACMYSMRPETQSLTLQEIIRTMLICGCGHHWDLNFISFPQRKLSFEIVVKRLSLSNASTLSEKMEMSVGYTYWVLIQSYLTQHKGFTYLHWAPEHAFRRNYPLNFPIFPVVLGWQPLICVLERTLPILVSLW